MTLRTRRMVLSALIGLFLVSGPAITLYAFGLRLDFENLRIVKVGGIFFNNLPSNALIKIDNKPWENQGKKFLSGMLLSNMVPGSYEIKIEKDGYYSWEKSVEVLPSVVSETKPIILIPQKSPAPLFKTLISNFWVNDSTLVYKDFSGNYFLTDLDNLQARTNLSALFNNLKERVLDFPGYVPIADLAPTNNQNRWIVSTAKAHYLLGIKNLSLELLEEKPLPPEPSAEEEGVLEQLARTPLLGGAKKYSYNEGRVYFLKNSQLSFLDLKDK